MSYVIIIFVVMVIVIVIVIVLVMLIVSVRLLIHVILILLLDYYIDITTCSIVNGKSICIIHNRNHNHVNIDGKLLL
jgi:hypothetical protein